MGSGLLDRISQRSADNGGVEGNAHQRRRGRQRRHVHYQSIQCLMSTQQLQLRLDCRGRHHRMKSERHNCTVGTQGSMCLLKQFTVFVGLSNVVPRWRSYVLGGVPASLSLGKVCELRCSLCTHCASSASTLPSALRAIIALAEAPTFNLKHCAM